MMTVVKVRSGCSLNSFDGAITKLCMYDKDCISIPNAKFGVIPASIYETMRR